MKESLSDQYSKETYRPYIVCATHENEDRWVVFSFKSENYYETTDDQIGNTVKKKGIPKDTYNFVRVFAALDRADAVDTAKGMGLTYEPPSVVAEKKMAQAQQKKMAQQLTQNTRLFFENIEIHP